MSNPNVQTIIALNMALILQLVGVVTAVLIDPYVKKENRRRAYLIALIVAYLIIEPQISEPYGRELFGTHVALGFTITSCISYIVRVFVLYLFIRLSGNDWGLKYLFSIVLINTIICLTPLFAPWVFKFTETGRWIRGPLGLAPFVTSFILILWLVIGAFIKYRGLRRAESLVPAIIAIIVAIAVFMDLSLTYNPPVSFLTVAITESTVFFYIWMHLQFIREHENAVKAEQRIKIMISQIQPHFLFNALSTIQALTETDPERASKVIEEFAVYLRQNINSLNQDSLIPVKKEIEHTRAYSDIEQVRFPSIRIEYDIADENFLIPPLTIQPMVENAIRHGVRGKKHGWVSVSTYLDGETHVIVICDNGKGFDVDKMMEATEKGDHIGVRNVRDRIESMAGGTFSLESVVGEGTTITIRIPVRTDEVEFE